MIRFASLFILLALPVCALEVYLVEELTEYNYTIQRGEYPAMQQQIPASRLCSQQHYIAAAPQDFSTIATQRRYIRDDYRNPDPGPKTETKRIFGSTELKPYAVEHYEVVMASEAGQPNVYTIFPTTIRLAAYIDIYGGGSVSINGQVYSVPAGGYLRVPLLIDQSTEDHSHYRALGEYIAVTQSYSTDVPLYRQGYSGRQIFAPANLKYKGPVPV